MNRLPKLSICYLGKLFEAYAKEGRGSIGLLADLLSGSLTLTARGSFYENGGPFQ
jgi:hypothetical protein